MSPIYGQKLHFTPYSIASEAEVETAIQKARNTAMRAMLVMLLGDPKWLGSKRGCFRPAEFCAVETDPVSMQIDLTAGSALVQNGIDYAGDWFFIFTDDAEVSVTIDESHPTLDRYDIIYLVPAIAESGTVIRSVVDANGNVANVTDHEYELDTFSLGVEKGTAGAADPGYTRLDAYSALAAGRIPIATVHVAAGVTTITQDDLTDLRELFIPRQLPIDLVVSGQVKQAMNYIMPANISGQPIVLYTGGSTNWIDRDTLFIDKTAGSPGTLKYKKDDDSILSIG